MTPRSRNGLNPCERSLFAIQLIEGVGYVPVHLNQRPYYLFSGILRAGVHKLVYQIFLLCSKIVRDLLLPNRLQVFIRHLPELFWSQKRYAVNEPLVHKAVQLVLVFAGCEPPNAF